jgi:citrate (Si)-synthase
MYYETSLLDAQEGIRIRGFSLPELQAKLPTFKGPAGEGEPIPEALIWLLLTSEIPSVEQTRQLTAELRSRATLPAHIEPLIRSLPKTMHPMTQLSLALLACQTDSKFAAAYAKGVNKSKYWESTLEVKYCMTCYYICITNLSFCIPNFIIISVFWTFRMSWMLWLNSQKSPLSSIDAASRTANSLKIPLEL